MEPDDLPLAVSEPILDGASMSRLHFLLALVLLTLGTTTLSACNTLGGAAGGAVEDVSDGIDAMSDDDDDDE
jgi:predicted small secreted protein